MLPAAIVFAYLAIVFYIGIFAFRKSTGKGGPEDFFLAGRSLGSAVFLLSMFGANMTAFSILGASGHAFHNGIVTYALMASSSGLVIPLTFVFIGTRVWALGKRHGFMTPVQMFRDRWECGHIGTIICLLQTALLVPYVIIGVMGGGTALQVISGGLVPYWFGGAVVALVVMSYVFFGGMRGTAWVNAFQASLFLCFGAIALGVIGYGMGGFGSTMKQLLASPDTAPLLTRERFSPLFYFSYTLIPLSTISFPHIGIFCLTAEKMSHFKRTSILYPLCIVAIWLPSVFLGVAANRVTDVPAIREKIEARQEFRAATNPAQKQAAREKMAADDVMLILLDHYAPAWLAGLLGAGIMAAVMASDSQILALSTMFAEDIFAFYGGARRFGEKVQVQTGRAFVILITIVAYAIALKAPATIFELAVQYAFTGYAALIPLLIAALFWRRSTKWGALACTLWTAGCVLALSQYPPGTTIYGFHPVAPITLGSAVCMIVFSLVTQAPGKDTLRRFSLS